MEEKFRQRAKEQGFTDQEIDEFLGVKTQEQPTQIVNDPVFSQAKPLSIDNPEDVKQIVSPDIVSPFVNDQVVKTQGMGENPQSYGPSGHRGEDYAYIRNPEHGTPTTEDEIRASIGGLVLSGYQPGGYGNVSAVIGANPQELAQMSPEEKQQLQAEFETNLPGANSIKDFPSFDKYGNAMLVGHGSNQPLPSGTEVATGSAILREGNTGRSTGQHSHLEALRQGQEIPFSQLMDIVRKRLYR